MRTDTQPIQPSSARLSNILDGLLLIEAGIELESRSSALCLKDQTALRIVGNPNQAGNYPGQPN